MRAQLRIGEAIKIPVCYRNDFLKVTSQEDEKWIYWLSGSWIAAPGNAGACLGLKTFLLQLRGSGSWCFHEGTK